MMKKVFKIGLMVSLMLTSMSVFAQNTNKAEYPKYGFFSNWSFGGSLDLNWEIQQGAMGFNDNRWRVSTNVGNDLFLQKKLNHWLDWRIRFGAPTWGKPRTDATGDGEYRDMDRHWSISLDLLFSINNAILGYDPDRRFSFYVMAGAGSKMSGNIFKGNDEERANTHYTDKQIGRMSVMISAGLGASYRLGDDHTIFCEYGFDFTDFPNLFASDVNTYHRWHSTNGILRLGYAYNLGTTAADQAVSAQKAMLTQENFGALNNQVSNLENQIAADRNNEKKLKERIQTLEDELEKALANQGTGNSAAADSLQAVIDNIKKDQTNFYAMPFSVQYDVNEWKVADEEADKVKAVAKVLNANSDVKIRVVGFADHTGSAAYNQKLSERRANEVKRILVKQYGIAEDRIQVEAKGQSEPFGDLKYALNRRVSFYRVIE